MATKVRDLFPKQVRGGFDVKAGLKAGPSTQRKAVK